MQVKGFASNYGLDKLVYYEIFEDISLAILREKKLKKFIRQWKINLINQKNVNWNDLSSELI
jgi:putative endonuclease